MTKSKGKEVSLVSSTGKKFYLKSNHHEVNAINWNAIVFTTKKKKKVNVNNLLSFQIVDLRSFSSYLDKIFV